MSSRSISKIIYSGEVLADLTADTVTADSLLAGFTAHRADGSPIVGQCTFDCDTGDASAEPGQLLSGRTAYAKGTQLAGTMPDNGAFTGVISRADEACTIPTGYHNGNGQVQLDSTACTALRGENIRQGFTILGVDGSMSGLEDVRAQSVNICPAKEEQVVIPDSVEGYNYLSQVTVSAIPYTETENSSGGITVSIG